MAQLFLNGNTVNTMGELPDHGETAPDFHMIKSDLSDATLKDYRGKRVLMNIFPSIDTGTCAKSVRKFNETASKLKNTAVLCISRDLPFAQKRFFRAEGIEHVEALSDFSTGDFGRKYGLTLADGPWKNLHSRAVIVLDEEGKVLYTNQVREINDEPDYEKVLEVLS